MQNYHIGLSGLNVAQQALEVIGTNIANASTDGYHKQDVRIVPLSLGEAIPFGGARIDDVRRVMDDLLEGQLLQQRPQMGQIFQELMALNSVEGALGDLDSEGLVKAIGNFFDALQELAAQPDSRALQDQAVRAGDTLAKSFQNFGRFLDDLEEYVLMTANDLIAEVNGLTSEIAELNDDIRSLVIRGGNANLLTDRRDQAVTELAELMDLQVTPDSQHVGVVDVLTCGTSLVAASSAMELDIGLVDDELVVSITDSNAYLRGPESGRLGGLLSVRNTILAETRTTMETLAEEICHGINAHHVQGVGSAGAFTSLTGWLVSDQTLENWDDWGSRLGEGTVHLRVTDHDAGTTARHAVAVTAADTAASIAAKLAALDGLTATVADSALRIAAADPNRYTFDFLPVPITTLQGGWTGTSQPDVTGIYTGSQNQLFTCTVAAGGTVGVTSGLAVEVRNEANQLLATLNLGLGYAAGDRLDVAEGLCASFQTGTLTAGETFTIQALADADTSGFLAATGINAFFEGDSLITMAVAEEVLANPERLATAVGEEMSDNTNARRMADLGEQQLAALGNLSPADAYRMLATRVGQRIKVAEARQAGLESMTQQLLNQRDAISGVDLNEEAGKLLMFENMFQALAKWISLQESALQSLMEIV